MNKEELFDYAKQAIDDEGLFTTDQILALKDMVNFIMLAIETE